MPDPLSIAAGVAGLVSLGLQVTENLFKFYTRYKDRNVTIARTTDKLEKLLVSLRSINDTVRTRKWKASEQNDLVNVEASILGCKTIIEELQEEMKKISKVPKDSIISTLKSTGRRAAYPIRCSTLEKLVENISGLRDDLRLALEPLTLASFQKLDGDVEENKMIVSKLLSQTVSESVRYWLKAPDATVDYNTAFSKRHVNTGSWFVRGDQFTTWLQQDNSFLWLHGFSGCGKSVLLSTAILHAFCHRREQKNSAIAFFFFTFNDETKQDASAMLRALLFQLCGQISGVEDDLVRLKDSYNLGIPPVDVLQEHLKQAISRASHVYILLDALDECPEDDQRREALLSLIGTMRAWSLPGLHLLVTSRDLEEIRQALNATTSEQAAFSHQNIQDIRQDIENFVSYKLKQDPQLQLWEEYTDRIKDYLTNQANGVFRWVDCQLNALRKSPKSLDDLEKCLRSLPATLDKTYERMLCSIEKSCKDRARRLLALLCFSHRPLSVAEVIDALAVDVEHNESFEPRRRVKSFRDLHIICPGFIDTHPQQHDDDTSSTHDGYVRIAHFSVQEYLLSPEIARGPARDFTLKAAEGHALISKTCLIYLCNERFSRQALSNELLKQYPLAKFSSRYWDSHYRQAEGSQTTSLDKMVLDLLTNKQTFDRCIQLYKPDEPWRNKILEKLLNHAQPLYYAALLGMHRIVSQLVRMTPKNVNASGGIYGNALQAASHRGHEQVVKLLLENGADIDAEGGYYGNVLLAASCRGHKRVVKILLEKGADIDIQGDSYGNALYAASYHGHVQTVQFLLENGAKFDVKGENHDALQAASLGGYERIVQILLGVGADIHSKTGRYGGSLQAASFGGHTQIVKALLGHGADANAPGGVYGHPLQAASVDGHEQVVQMLLDNGAMVDAEGGVEYKNALQAASSNGHGQVVKMLLDKGADINAQTGLYGRLLQQASEYGHEQVVQVLLSKEVATRAHAQRKDYIIALLTALKKRREQIVKMLLEEVDLERGERSDALLAASYGGHRRLVRLMLDKGADVNAPTRDGYALQVASRHGHKKVVKGLLNKGADVNAPAGEVYGNALQAASEGGHKQIVRILLFKGADVDAPGRRQHGNALQAASAKGHQQVVRILLDRGANVNAEGGKYGNALQAALECYYPQVAKMLLDRGANANAEGGGSFGNALYAASYFGDEQVVQMLLDRGADVNIQSRGEYGNALWAALNNDHKQVVQMLLDKGAIVNIQDGQLDYSLQLASARGNKQIVQILLDKGADINAPGGSKYGSALYAASSTGDEQIVQMLLAKGAKINASSGGTYGNSLQVATVYGHEQVMQMLLHKGADICAQGGFYDDALQAAVNNGRERIMQILLNNEVDRVATHAQRKGYINALQGASCHGNEQIVQMLIDKGADVNTPAEVGYGNALQAASYYGYEQIVKMLLRRGADIYAEGGKFENALQAASNGGHERILHMLQNIEAARNSAEVRWTRHLTKLVIFAVTLMIAITIKALL